MRWKEPAYRLQEEGDLPKRRKLVKTGKRKEGEKEKVR